MDSSTPTPPPDAGAPEPRRERLNSIAAQVSALDEIIVLARRSIRVFDIDLARSSVRENPVYYVQYTHARICRVGERFAEQGWTWDRNNGLASLERLDTEYDQDMMVAIARFPEVVDIAAKNLEPHLVATYLTELAAAFHTWYDNSHILLEDADLRDARFALADAVRTVVANGLDLLGVSAPESM